MQFEWDENKNQGNIEKHGIDFTDSISIFDDKYRIETVVDKERHGEERLQVIGEAKPGVIFVVYTWRENYTLRRIISARPASRKERAVYQNMKRR